MGKMFAGLVGIPLAIGGLYLAVVLNYSYSEGDRAGYLQKLSEKGWLCKTHEGELAMTTVPGLAPEIWPFTVWSSAVASQVTPVLGKKVILHYKEHRGLPTTCFGETAYFVDRIELAKD